MLAAFVWWDHVAASALGALAGLSIWTLLDAMIDRLRRRRSG
jgi:hypothetical protein